MPQLTLEQALNLAVQHQQAGRLAEAESICRQVLAIQPNHAFAMNLLGIALFWQGRVDEAIVAYRRALTVQPNHVAALNGLGLAHHQQGKLGEAIQCYRKALALMPECAEVLYNLGNSLQSLGRSGEAIECYQRALLIQPNNAQTLNNLGNALRTLGRIEEALQAYQQAVAIKPDYFEAYNNLGTALQQLGRHDEAIVTFRRALAINSEEDVLWSNLGNAIKEQGSLDEAIAAYRRALLLNPACETTHSNLLYALLFHPNNDAATICAEHRLWNQRHAAPLQAGIRLHTNERVPGRRLRIGYVSADFRKHAVALFLLPLLAKHDHGEFEVFGYAEVAAPDAMTERLRACTDQWRSIAGVADEQVAELIRQDGIDILVDLSGHTAGNRLLVFARKPAPVQVTYLGYCGTTGLDATEYRITDPYLDPPGMENPYYSERSIHLPHSYWCYQAPTEAPESGALPAVFNGRVTFGCLNNFCKVSPAALAAWCRLLREVSGSRLLLHSLEGSHRQRVQDVLTREGIDSHRLSFVTHQLLNEYLATYRRIDVALDPFPYNGGTTTCDALWMGVPVVSLAGQTAMGRAGLSILSNVGMPELVARSENGYVKIAADLAGDLPRLAELRRTLRQRMLASPLMDAPGFARGMEAAYRQMWREWCAESL